MPAKPPYNIIVFGEPEVDRKDVIELAGREKITDTPPEYVFQSTRHPIVISGSQFYLYDTAGLSKTRKLPEPVDALSNLHQVTTSLSTCWCTLSTIFYVRKRFPSFSLRQGPLLALRWSIPTCILHNVSLFIRKGACRKLY
jgi:hypothetical protein